MSKTLLAFLTAALLVAPSIYGQDSSDQRIEDAVGEKRMQFLRDKMERYEILASDDGPTAAGLDDQLALRWSNPVSGVVDGAIFVWSDRGRPVIVGKAYINEDKEAWGEVLQSVSASQLVVKFGEKPIWRPLGHGITFKEVNVKAKASTTEAGRLRQMRELARKLEVVGIWGEKEAAEWNLRTLTTPVRRYSSDSEGIIDGAIFACSQGGTNPEAVALIEFVKGSAGEKWQIAVARLSKYGVRAKFDGEVICDVPRSETPEVTEPFYHQWHYFTRYPFAKHGKASP
jgi:hypothetical protein